ncbi:Permease of the drug/metabolite transporter (DMT) superfamily [Loktanella atrilutea]|uniref:Permease of the drug/metabolite transporter (DMT) superfamily n=1 Tax=Loktanella atrilutea TaxID=366533 RepID=A0A1M4YG27_LOKAT|nr:DMT family transporter [Loktanella atrilutea]SHF04629.1 Permease of the drug/metabolite transporter (DMT) superfamily [Loktanella atrilutea]
MSSNARGALLALIAFGIFATHDVLIKVLGGSYSPIQIVFFSVTLAFPLATVSLMRDNNPGTLQPRHPWWMLLRTVTAIVTGFCAFYAFTVLPLAQVYAILFAAPLLITILSVPILGETVRLRRWLAVIVGLIGVLVVLRPGSTVLQLGHAAALLSAVGGSLGSIIVRKIGADERPVVLMLFPMLGNFLVMGSALAFVYQPLPIAHIGMLAVISILAFVAGLLVIAAYKAGEAVIVAPMQYSQILWATAYGMLFFDETPDGATVLGAGIIIASGLYIVLRESRSEDSATPVLRTRARFETGTFLRPRPRELDAPKAEPRKVPDTAPSAKARPHMRGLPGRVPPLAEPRRRDSD